jgi:xanthine dehydrogenase/oxidase
MLACETVVEHVAAYVKVDPLVIRRLNLYKEGDLTHYGQRLEQWNVPRLLDELVISSDFVQRQKSVEAFNRANNYRKRGLSIVPNKFTIGFAAPFLNQAGALVLIYKDGSVVVNHGGISIDFIK